MAVEKRYRRALGASLVRYWVPTCGVRQRLATLTSLSALLAACVACTAPRDGSVLEFWAVGREGEVVAALIPEFEASHPGIKVEVQQLPWRGAHEKLLTAVVGDATPDLAQLGNTWIPEFATIGALAELGSETRASALVPPGDYFEGIWDTNRFDGALYGVPWYVDTRLLFYRRDLLSQAGFAQAPRSWSEWLTMLRAIREQARAERGQAEPAGGERAGLLLPLNEAEALLAFGLQQPEPLLREQDGFGNFRSASFRRALEFYVGLFQSGLAPRATSTQIANLWDEFARGSFVFYISGPWQIGELDRRLPPELHDAWRTAPLPGPEGPGASLAGGSSLVVFERSRHKAAAWQLIEYLSGPAVQQRFYALTGNLPPRRTSWAGEPLASDVRAAAFRDQLERVLPTPKVPEWERIASEVAIVGERAAYGAASVGEAAAELDARADRILEKRRWLLARRGAQ